MKRYMLLSAIVMLGSCQAIEVGIPAILYETDDVRGVVGWVSRWVEYEADNGDLGIAAPLTTYDTRLGNCEDATVLAMFLLHRDLGVDSVMGVGLLGGRFHAYVIVDGKSLDAVTGFGLAGEPLFTLSYDTVMALAGSE